ncbi:hypothetical protein GBA52_026202 [Prunus armeniaca]|nr:hypothetical protein GBA52_026202 [Prunus armeniaca]
MAMKNVKILFHHDLLMRALHLADPECNWARKIGRAVAASALPYNQAWNISKLPIQSTDPSCQIQFNPISAHITTSEIQSF